jgi:hypothetical protein
MPQGHPKKNKRRPIGKATDHAGKAVALGFEVQLFLAA